MSPDCELDVSVNKMRPPSVRYDPYGRSTTKSNGFSSSYQNPYAFGVGIRDRATGEVKFGKRFYSPVTGSWTQQDTLNAPLDPANANRYEYAADNPINHADPTGNEDCGKDLAVTPLVGAGSGAVTGLLGGPFAEVTVPGGALSGFTTGVIGGTLQCDWDQPTTPSSARQMTRLRAAQMRYGS